MTLNEIASTIINDLWGGNLIPLSNRSLISIEQVEDECIAEREQIVREWYFKNILYKNDLAFAINCIPVDCKDPNKCPCRDVTGGLIQHFEIPQLMDGLGKDAIIFLGSTDRSVSYNVYFSQASLKFQKYHRRNLNKPYVYIEKTPNENGLYDGWIFNAPFVQYIAIIGIFKDPRQIERYGCCKSSADFLELGSLSSEIIRRILAKKASLYRTAVLPASQITS